MKIDRGINKRYDRNLGKVSTIFYIIVLFVCMILIVCTSVKKALSYGLGCFEPNEEIEKEYQNHTKGFLPEIEPDTNLPKNYFLYEYQSPIRNQGERATSVAFAITAMREFVEWSDPSEYDFGPDLTFRQLSTEYLYWRCKQLDPNKSDEETNIETGMEVLRRYGVCPEDDWPYDPDAAYDPNVTPPPQADPNAHIFISRFMTIPNVDRNHELNDPNALTTKYMQACLANGNVFVAALPIYEHFLDPNHHRFMDPNCDTNGIYGNRIGYHAVLIIGYKDVDPNDPNETEAYWADYGGGYFMFKNSWGTDWGSAGYGYVSYSYMLKHSRSRYSIVTNPIEKGLMWLRRTQNNDGSWTYYPDYMGITKSVGITSLAVLSFLNHRYYPFNNTNYYNIDYCVGYVSGICQGYADLLSDANFPADKTVVKGLNYIISQCDPDDGSIRTAFSRKVYETSMAILPLIAVYRAKESVNVIENWEIDPNLDGLDILDTTLLNAADYLLAQQCKAGNDFFGGWRYPDPSSADLSNTQFVVLALEAVNKAGINIPVLPSVWQDVANFAGRCQNPDPDNAGFGYHPGSTLTGSMTAAGLWTLLIAEKEGIANVEAGSGSPAITNLINNGFSWLDPEYIHDNQGSSGWFYYYTLYGISKAYVLAGLKSTEYKYAADDASTWFNNLKSHLADIQLSDGRWQSGDSTHIHEKGGNFATSLAILALQTDPNAIIPEFLSQDPNQARELWILLNSPAYIYVTNPEGKHIGTDPLTGEVVNEIEGATYSSPRFDSNLPEAIKIPNPKKGRYEVKLIGTGTGQYELSFKGISSGIEVASETITGEITTNEREEADLVLTSIVGEMDIYVNQPEIYGDIDKDGDVDVDDYIKLAARIGICDDSPDFSIFEDLDDDFCITMDDLMILTLLINKMPVANAGQDQTLEQDSHKGAWVCLDASLSSDPEGKPLTYRWTWDGGWKTGINPCVVLPLGETTIKLTVDDGLAISTDTVVITVVDTTLPVIICPQDITTEQQNSDGASVNLGVPIVSDVCDPNPQITNDAPAIFPLGTTQVTWTVTDSSDNFSSCTQTITVIDTTPPEITCPQNITTEQQNPDGASVNLDVPIVSDVCDPNPQIMNDAPALFPLGTTQVTWTATDASGNSSSCTQTITIVDTTPPEITCHPNITAEQQSPDGASVDIGAPCVSDACDTNPLITNDALAIFPPGATQVTWTATDASGNTSSCIQTITVVDTTPPEITCPRDVSVMRHHSKERISVEIRYPRVSDLCDPNPVVTNDAPGLFRVGETIVTWTATDASGNSSSCTQTVNVVGASLHNVLDNYTNFMLFSTNPNWIPYNNLYLSNFLINPFTPRYNPFYSNLYSSYTYYYNFGHPLYQNTYPYYSNAGQNTLNYMYLNRSDDTQRDISYMNNPSFLGIYNLPL